MIDKDIYDKIRSYTDIELEKFLEEFYDWAYVDGHNGNDSNWNNTLTYTMIELDSR